MLGGVENPLSLVLSHGGERKTPKLILDSRVSTPGNDNVSALRIEHPLSSIEIDEETNHA